MGELAGSVAIRPYEARDRAQVRRICFDTGYMGEPIGWQWRDQESFADLFSSAYTDREPESCFVADAGDRVVGYLLGARDAARLGDPVAPLVPHLVRRALLVRPGTAGVLWRSIADGAIEVARTRQLPAELHDPRWPAELHINLLPEARGGGMGRRLVHTWFDLLRAEQIPGCHLGMWAENAGGRAFFESVGFVPHGPPQPMPGMRSPTGARHHTQWMTIDLRP